MPLSVDATDPLVVLFAWLLTSVVGKLGAKRSRQVKHLLPAVAVLTAVGLRASVAVLNDTPLSAEMALRALAAGGVAVLTHSQMREVQKMRAETVPPSSSAPAPVPFDGAVPPGEGA